MRTKIATPEKWAELTSRMKNPASRKLAESGNITITDLDGTKYLAPMVKVIDDSKPTHFTTLEIARVREDGVEIGKSKCRPS